MNPSPHLISVDDLATRLGQPGLAIVDASWYLPAQQRDGAAEYRAAHIPGAVFFDIDAIADKTSSLPHMLPDAAGFAAAVGALGISDTDEIVVYDGAGLFSAPRVWWTFRQFGARKVRILDGGFPAWQKAGLPVGSGVIPPAPTTFRATPPATGVYDADAVAAALADNSATVVDARPAERFAGAVPEPRQGVRAGHMPGARNLPSSAVVEKGRLASPETIRAALAAAGIDPAHPVVTSCGSGVSAAILTLALDSVGQPLAGLYDGSWTEWGADQARPLATGPAGPAQIGTPPD